MGAGGRGVTMTNRAGTLSLTTSLQVTGRGELEFSHVADDLINHAHVVKPQEKPLGDEA